MPTVSTQYDPMHTSSMLIIFYFQFDNKKNKQISFPSQTLGRDGSKYAPSINLENFLNRKLRSSFQVIKKLLLFKKVAILKNSHALIHGMINYSINFGPNESFSQKK